MYYSIICWVEEPDCGWSRLLSPGLLSVSSSHLHSTCTSHIPFDIPSNVKKKRHGRNWALHPAQPLSSITGSSPPTLAMILPMPMIPVRLYSPAGRTGPTNLPKTNKPGALPALHFWPPLLSRALHLLHASPPTSQSVWLSGTPACLSLSPVLCASLFLACHVMWDSLPHQACIPLFPYLVVAGLESQLSLFSPICLSSSLVTSFSYIYLFLHSIMPVSPLLCSVFPSCCTSCISLLTRQARRRKEEGQGYGGRKIMLVEGKGRRPEEGRWGRGTGNLLPVASDKRVCLLRQDRQTDVCCLGRRKEEEEEGQGQKFMGRRRKEEGLTSSSIPHCTPTLPSHAQPLHSLPTLTACMPTTVLPVSSLPPSHSRQKNICLRKKGSSKTGISGMPIIWKNLCMKKKRQAWWALLSLALCHRRLSLPLKKPVRRAWSLALPLAFFLLYYPHITGHYCYGSSHLINKFLHCPMLLLRSLFLVSTASLFSLFLLFSLSAFLLSLCLFIVSLLPIYLFCAVFHSLISLLPA